jgi:hypothetical protein
VTLTEAPNRERIRLATGGPKPRSPAGVLASEMEKRSKKFGNAEPGIALPRLSMITESGTAPRESRTVSSSSENLTAVSSRACNARMNNSSFAKTRLDPSRDDVMATRRERANYNSGKPIALVCHSPGVLRHVTYQGAPLVKGKHVAGFTNGEEEEMKLTKVVPFLVEDELLGSVPIREGGELAAFFCH